MPRALPPDGVPARLAGYLRWLIAIRLVVITSVVLPYLLVQLSSPEGQPPSFDLLYLIAGSTYVASLVYIALLSVLRRHPTWHAYLQFGGDLLLVTSLVYFFGGIGSPFSMLYLVVIMVASVLLRHRAGLLVATGAYLLYASLLIALARGWLPQGAGRALRGRGRLAAALQPGRPLLRLLRGGAAHLLPRRQRHAAPSASSRRSATAWPTSRSSTATSCSRSRAA